MLRRRRPLARAAVVGGVAYHAGKRRADNQAHAEDAAYQEGYEEAQGVSDEDIAHLKRLADLKEQGVLTDAEFEEQKAKILGS
jgi:hypothetical protein